MEEIVKLCIGVVIVVETLGRTHATYAAAVAANAATELRTLIMKYYEC